jgi:hypothetical protein
LNVHVFTFPLPENNDSDLDGIVPDGMMRVMAGTAYVWEKD